MNSRAREGDLYRRIDLHGKTFIIYYGYYDERERESKWDDPIPIYPNFLIDPEHTREGFPFVTAMQDACKGFRGTHPDDGCHGCLHYKGGDDLIGICTCPKNRKQ
jgi:hypothetical protein